MTQYIDPRGKLAYHADRIAQIAHGDQPAPVNVEIDLSNRCNLGCDLCHFGHVHSRGPLARRRTHDTGDLMNTGLAFDIVKQLERAGVRSITWTGGGEPTMHPDFDEIITDCNIDQGIYTNGTQVTPVRATLLKMAMKWVYVSLDRHTRESYRDYKKVDGFEKAINGIRNLVRAQGPATIGVGFLLDSTSWGWGNEMIDLALGLGVDYVQLRPMIEFDAEHPNRMMGDNTWIKPCVQWLESVMDRPEARQGRIIADISRFKMLYSWTGHSYPTCYWSQMQTVITPDGRVWTCVNRRGGEGDCVGDLRLETFEDAWRRSAAYQVNENCRVMCRGHIPNLELSAMIDSRPDHWRFI